MSAVSIPSQQAAASRAGPRACLRAGWLGLLALVLLAAGQRAQAATFTWSGAGPNDTWSNNANWGGTAPANNGTADVQFAGSTRLTPDMDADWNILSLAFNSGAGAFTLGSTGGKILTIRGGGITNNSTNTETINNAITLGAAQTWSATSGNLAVGGAVVNGGFLLSISGGSNTTISSVLSGTGGLTKNGAGTLTLSGLNTYSGTTTITAGQVTISTDTALGTGTITLSGGTLFASGGRTLANALNVTANSTLSGNNSDDFFFTSNSISGSAGVTLSLTSGNAASTTVMNLLGTGFTFDSNIVLDNYTRVRTRNTSGTITFTGVISGTGDDSAGVAGGFEVYVAGGTTILSGANTYSSRTAVFAGTLIIQNSSALGSTANGTGVSSGADLRLQGNISVGAEALSLAGTGIGGAGALRNVSGNNSWAGAVTLQSASTIASDAGTLTIGGTIDNGTFLPTFTGAGNTAVSGIISNTGGLTKSGAGTLTLSGANTYAGATAVSVGVLNIQNATALGGTTTGTTVSTGAALQIQGSIAVGAEALTLNGSGIASDGALRNISGTNSYAGAVTLGSASTVYADAGTLTLSGTIAESTFLMTVDGPGNVTASNVISGSGGLTKNGAGTLTLSGTNTYTGTNTINGGTVVVNSTSSLGAMANATTINAATLEASATFTTTRAFTLGNAASAIMVDPSQTFTVNTGIAGTGGLTKTGTGTLALGAANTFSGNTTVSGGTLAANAAGALGSTAKVTINTGGTVLLGTAAGNDRIGNSTEIALAGGTFHTGGFSETVGKMTLSANSTLDFGAGASLLTFDGTSSLGSSTLTVLNWTGLQNQSGGTDRLLFSNSSFTAGTNTALVQFNIGGSFFGGTFLSVGGSTLELVPVPEPATIFGASALLLGIAWRERRRVARLVEMLRSR